MGVEPRTIPAFSFLMNATSIIAIGFEQMIVAAVQEAKPLIDRSRGRAAEAMAFLRQEAQHSSTHRKHVNALIKHYPGLQETFDAMMASFDRDHRYRVHCSSDWPMSRTPRRRSRRVSR